MPRNPKFFIPGMPTLITSSTEEDLPFAANPVMTVIMLGIIAEALSRYEVYLSHYLLQANHFHGIAVCHDPEHLSKFMQYLKRESSQAVNRLLGRGKKTVWCDRFDSPVILDPDKVVEKTKYLYLNPVKDNLVAKVSEFPGISSYKMFVTGNHVLKAKRIARSQIPVLPKKVLEQPERHRKYYKNLAEQLVRESNQEEKEIVIYPDKCLTAFSCTKEEVKDYYAQMLKDIENKEEELEEARERPVLGVRALKGQSIGKEYQPNRKGIKTICLASCRKYRTKFIRFAKYHFERAREYIQLFLANPSSCDLANAPPNIFFPGGKIYQSYIPSALFEMIG